MEIVILDSGYKSYSFEKKLFEKNAYHLKIFPSYKGDRSKKIDFAKNADGILVRHTIINEVFLSKMMNLKAIVRYGVGYDNIDLNECGKYGVKVANVQGYANHAVSDHAIALMFSCTRGMWNTKLQLMQGFASPPVPDVFELYEKTLGIIGLGRIGSVFCKKASPFFRQVLASDPYKPEDHFTRLLAYRVELNELLENSDVISLHCSLNNTTHHLLDEAKFSLMKKKPVIINTSRGSVICESALLNALNSGQIHSMGLDVYEDEPITENQSKLINHPRAICTGHYAWYSDRSAIELQKRAALNLLNLLKGNKVEDCLN